MLGSALSVETARGLVGRKVEIAKVREPGTVTAKVTGVFGAEIPTEKKPLLLKVLAQRYGGPYEWEASFVAVWPGSVINVLA